jgi:hypothetical protein
MTGCAALRPFVLKLACEHNVREPLNELDHVVAGGHFQFRVFTFRIPQNVMGAAGELLTIGCEVTGSALSTNQIIDPHKAGIADGFELGAVGEFAAGIKGGHTAVGEPQGAAAGDDGVYRVLGDVGHLDALGQFVAKAPHDGGDGVPALVTKAAHGFAVLVGASVAALVPFLGGGLEGECAGDAFYVADVAVGNVFFQFSGAGAVQPHGAIHELDAVFLADRDGFLHAVSQRLFRVDVLAGASGWRRPRLRRWPHRACRQPPWLRFRRYR